jgi:hypothetical protein
MAFVEMFQNQLYWYLVVMVDYLLVNLNLMEWQKLMGVEVQVLELVDVELQLVEHWVAAVVLVLFEEV